MLQPLPPPPLRRDEEDPVAGDDEDERAPLRHVSKEVALVQYNATIKDQRNHDMLGHQLSKLTFLRPPVVHAYPAPDAVPPAGDPTLFHQRPPMVSYLSNRRSYVDRWLNSSCGRFSIFMLTCAFINLGIFGLVNWNKPSYQEEGSSFYYFWVAMFLMLFTYTIPLWATRAGMNALESGWKPYLVLWRLSLVTAIPACLLQVQGMGSENGFGTSSGSPGELKLQALANSFWNYFELEDGFVALNLTKGVVEMLAPEVHGVEDHRRFSRFRDAELRINREPYSDVPEPTEAPGRLTTYRVAPVFDIWAPCVSKYRISARCLMRNPVRAWAISRSTSICSRYKSVGCRPPKPYLEPVYQCSQDGGVKGKDTAAAMQGFCGHVTIPPPEGAIDELGALLLYDAWPKISLPTANSLWLDVTPDECISDPAACKGQWSQLYLAGLACQILTNLLIFIAAFCDCQVDAKIRQARYFVDKETRATKAGLPVAQIGK